MPQDAEQKTAKTQPIPRTGEFIPHTPATAADIARIKGELKGPAKDLPIVVAKEMFTPPSTKHLLIYGPGPMGGNNWQPSSYNQKTNMFYVCSAVQYFGVQSANTPLVKGKFWVGIGALAGIAWPEASGTFTAIDASSGKTMWQKTFPEACYSSTSTTAGNLVFVGRNSGELQAYNAENGNLLWSFQTGAGANNAPTIFEHKGKEYLAYLSAGNSLMATVHGDSLWVFGLDGTMGPAVVKTKGKGTEHAGEGGGKKASTTKGDAVAGAAVFNASCSGCHGALGTGGNGGPDLTAIPSAKSRAKVVAQVLNGGGGMPSYKGKLTSKQVADVSAYVTEKITK